MLRQSKKGLVDRQTYDHADVKQECHVHEEELNNKLRKKIEINLFIPISISLTCKVSFNSVIYSKSSVI